MPSAKAARLARAWTQRCAGHLQQARRQILPAVPGIAGFKVKIDPSPWNPTLRFEARPVQGGYYEGAVSHGRHPCVCFDSDDPAYNNLPWTNGTHSGRVSLDRIRRLQDDEAWLQANRVPPKTIDTFRRAFERALDTCLREAHSVPLVDAPSTISCVDKVDRCPERSDPAADDGCPGPPARRAPPRARPRTGRSVLPRRRMGHL